MAKKQTAGRDRLGKLAPQFAALNDDVLFGEVWAREEQLSARDRSMITIAALFSAGLYPQLKSHLILGKEQSSFFSHYDPNMVEWFAKMVEERKHQHDSSKEKKNW